MTWFASSTNAAEVLKNRYFPFLAVDFDFPSGHYRFWTGSGELTISTDTYLGLGELAEISGDSETVDLGSQRRTYTLSGIDPATVDETDIDGSFGRAVVEYLGFLNYDTRTLIDTPEIFWEGRVDSFRRVDGAKPIIQLVTEHRLAALDRIDGWRFTHEHQQQFYAGDTGLDQVTAIALKKVVWGGKFADPALGKYAIIPGGPGKPRLYWQS